MYILNYCGYLTVFAKYERLKYSVVENYMSGKPYASQSLCLSLQATPMSSSASLFAIPDHHSRLARQQSATGVHESYRVPQHRAAAAEPSGT